MTSGAASAPRSARLGARFAGGTLITALGFFAIGAQALLFRRFLTAFSGSELAVGCFFASWLAWVAVGAWIGRLACRIRASLSARFCSLALAYLPAFIVQHLLLTQARTLAGIESYEAFPLVRLVIAAAFDNLPVSLATGFLFTLACPWWAKRRARGEDTDARALPVADVYILETLGAFAGGVFVTATLASGASAEAVAISVALVLAAATGWCALGEPGATWRTRLAMLAPALALAILFALRADRAWAEHEHRAAWSALLPATSYSGSFATAQGEYHYGEREGQFIVLHAGSTCEAVPEADHAGEVAALTLSQAPEAKNVLAVGPGALAFCLRLLTLERIESVTWLHPDPEYPPRLVERLPPAFGEQAARLTLPAGEARQFLEGAHPPYELIVMNLPDVTTLVLNRYATREWYALLKRSLAPNGVLAVRISGGANYLGGELALLGASALGTLENLFAHVALKPGDESWLLASDGAQLTTSPAELRDRFAAIPSADTLYPAEGLAALYPPDRIVFQTEAYRAVLDRWPALLVNTERQPKALLYGLLAAWRRAGWPSTVSNATNPALLIVVRAGPWILASGLILFALLRVLYRAHTAAREGGPQGGRALFDAYVLAASTGMAGMAMSIVLMFLFQAHFGSLYLHVGLAAALFMLGSFAGALTLERLVAWLQREPAWLIPALVVGEIAFMASLLAPAEALSRTIFAALFVLCGAFTGAYFPIAGHRLREAQRSDVAQGAALEAFDNFGGAAGAAITGVLLLPLFGTPVTVALVAALVGVNLAGCAAQRECSASRDRFAQLKRPLGYAMLGFAAWCMLASDIAARAAAQNQQEAFSECARSLASALAPAEAQPPQLTPKTATLADGQSLTYLLAAQQDGKPAGYIFPSVPLADGGMGFAGPIAMAVCVDATGALREFSIVESKETPAYVDLLVFWRKSLLGRNLFAPDPFAGVDAATGATVTGDAILQILESSGRRFATDVLHLSIAAQAPPQPSRPFSWPALCLATFLGAGVLFRYWPNRWVRRAVLVAAVLVFGMRWNFQYSTQHAFHLLAMSLPPLQWGAPALLILGVPIIVALFGNSYCGYACPFGALQELVGEVRPARLATAPHGGAWRYGRAVKYLLLAWLAVCFAATRDPAALSVDPLVTFFSQARDHLAVFLAGCGVALSFLFPRFWCRNLCPAGAFLALVGGLRLLRRWMPAPRPAQCDLGVLDARELDCIACDRCRHAKAG